MHTSPHVYPGKKFGRLTVLEMTDMRRNRSVVWKCRCSCENKTICFVGADNLVNGRTTSCGCYRREQIRNSKPIRTPEDRKILRRLNGMLSRCHNPNSKDYERYGGSGVYVCEEWRSSPDSFLKWAKSTGFRQNLEIDRYPDRNGPYAPWNCRWATKHEQSLNRSCCIQITAGGITDTPTGWERRLGFKRNQLRSIYHKQGEAALVAKIEGLLPEHDSKIIPTLIVPGSAF